MYPSLLAAKQLAPDFTSAKAANGTLIPISHKINVNMNLGRNGSESFSGTLHIVESMDYDLILGRDFL